MSLINGVSGLGAGLNAFAGAAIQEDMQNRLRASLLNNTPAAPTESTPAAAPPASPASPPPAPAAGPAPAAAPPAAATPGAKVGATPALSSIHPDLTTIAAPSGAKFTVAASAADKFAGLITDLEKQGYTIDPKTSGGYNPRMIAGTSTPSMHAYGLAIDVNSARNARGADTSSDLPADLARELAAKYGLTWGGDWKGSTRDPMHFEVTGGRPGSGAS